MRPAFFLPNTGTSTPPMKTTLRSRFLIAVIATMLLTPLATFGQGSIMLANPNWNITLSDFGYADFLSG